LGIGTRWWPWSSRTPGGPDRLAWAANNTLKHAPDGGGGGGGGGGCEGWTLISTPAYGRATKVPQEAVPPEVAKRVLADLLDAFAARALPHSPPIPTPHTPA